MSDRPSNLFWLDRLAGRVPGLAGYQHPGDRQASDRALRSALVQRIGQARDNIAAAIKQCLDRHAEREVGSLQLLDAELTTLVDRIGRAAGPGAFAETGAVGDAKAESLHALDHALLDQADQLITLTHHQPGGHDWLAELKSASDAFARKLDARAMLFQHFG